jgi:hypothetical protein
VSRFAILVLILGVSVAALFALARNERLRAKLPGALAAALGAAAIYVIIVAVLRARFPLDLLLWSESTTLTDMLKVAGGEPFFQAPALGNSFIYSPGLVYLHYALLHPFDLEFSITAHRLLVIACTILSALCFTSIVRELAPENRSWTVTIATFALFVIALHTNFAADLVHPDSLQALITSLCLLLVVRAIRGARIELAVAAIVVGAAGLLAKQTSGLLAPIAAACFVVCGPFSLRQRLLLCLLAIVLVGAGVGGLFSLPFARFYLLDVPRDQGVFWDRIPELMVELFLRHSWSLVTLIALLPLVSGARRDWQWILVWSFFLLGAGGLNFAAFLKAMGKENNLALFHVLLLAGALPPLLHHGLQRHSPPALSALVAIALFTFPLKAMPGADSWRYAAEMQQTIAQSLASREKLLVAHGAVGWIAAGQRSVPLDRANSVLELREAHLLDKVTMKQRISAKAYDRIILNSRWYGAELEAAIRQNYRQVGEIRAARGPTGYVNGLQADLMSAAPIFVPKAD